MTFDINAGDVIAIGEIRTFDALYQDDIIKNGTSPVKIARSETAKEIRCDFSGGLIEITLPADQHDRYLECGYKPEKYKALNAVLSIPALVEAIGIIANDVDYPDQPSGFESTQLCKRLMDEVFEIPKLQDGCSFMLYDNITGIAYSDTLKLVNGRAVKTVKRKLLPGMQEQIIDTNPKTLRGKREGSKVTIDDKKYVIKDIQ